MLYVGPAHALRMLHAEMRHVKRVGGSPPQPQRGRSGGGWGLVSCPPMTSDE